MAALPPGLNVSVHADEATAMADVLSETRDSIQRLVQSLQSGLADDKDTTFEYEDANGEVQVRIILSFGEAVASSRPPPPRSIVVLVRLLLQTTICTPAHPPPTHTHNTCVSITATFDILPGPVLGKPAVRVEQCWLFGQAAPCAKAQHDQRHERWCLSGIAKVLR